MAAVRSVSPASFTGLFGMKTSMGRVPLWPGCRDETLPGVSGWESVEHLGPISRTVADAALMFQRLRGRPAGQALDPLRGRGLARGCQAVRHLGLRIAYAPIGAGSRWTANPRDLRCSCRGICDRLHCIVEETPPPFGDELDAFRTIIAMDTDIEGLRRMIAETGRAVRPRLQQSLDHPPTADAMLAAGHRRRAAVNAMARFMARYDLLLTPTVSCLPFEIDRDGPGSIDGRTVADDAWTPTEFPANLTGQPSASVPAGWSSSGLPVGLQITGRHLADDTVLRVAATWEELRPWRHLFPPGTPCS